MWPNGYTHTHFKCGEMENFGFELRRTLTNLCPFQPPIELDKLFFLFELIRDTIILTGNIW
jgi:hypothetical protein